MKTYKVCVKGEWEKIVQAEDREKALDVAEQNGDDEFVNWADYWITFDCEELNK